MIDHPTDDDSRDAEYLRILAKTLQCGVSILDEKMNYMFLSDSAYEHTGTKPGELKPGDPLEKVHKIMTANGLLTPEIIESQRLAAQDQIWKNAEGQTDATRLITLGDGSTYRFIRRPLSCGKTVSISENVTELVEKDKLLDKALALGHAGYWSLDVATKTYTLSKTLNVFLGPDIEHKVNQNGILSVLHPDDWDSFRTAIRSAVKTENRFEVTVRSDNQRGQTGWIYTSGEIIRDSKGKAIRIEAFVKDVTRARRQAAELEEATERAIAASKAKSEFLANMSHEIRTPMNGILGMAELLKNSEVTERQREFVDVINNSASTLLNIINDILDFSKIEAGAFEIDPVPFNLKSSINDVTSLLLGSAQEKDIELIINYPTSLPTNFIGDVGRIRQVITNLVRNAVKFTEGGYITIDVTIQENRELAFCIVEVKDTGIGISPDKMDKIFEKFTQADSSTTRVHGGTGLGLTISKHIVEMMGGRIHVESTLGDGSTFGFRMSLPIDHDVKTESFDSELVYAKRALIVDDIGVNRDIFTEQLRAWGMETSTAIDGVEAMSKLKAAQDEDHPFDLIILDFLMPGIDGQDFAQLLTNSETLQSPQIIMLSSSDQPVSTSALGRRGVDSYLVKPVRERRLFDTIVHVLSNPMQSEAALPEAEPCDSRTRSTDKREILVAEDFPLNQDVVKLMMADSCFTPVFAKNGQVVLEIYMQDPGRFPMILMDLSMPIMDGYEATRKIRDFEADSDLDAIPIIALTGHALKNDREGCLQAGMNDYLSKPVKQIQLLDKLETYSGKAIHMRRAG